MPEIISLLSSPPNGPAGRPPWNRATSKSPRRQVTKKPTAKDIFHFTSDDFDFIGELDFPGPDPKKRKIESPPLECHKQIYNLLTDEDDFPAINSCHRETESSKGKNIGSPELLSDPIFFTSSAPEPRTAQKKNRVDILDLSDDVGLPDNIFGEVFPNSSQPIAVPPSRAALSDRTANLLANLGSQCEKPTVKARATGKSSTFVPRVPNVTATATVNQEMFFSTLEIPKRKKASRPVKLTEAQKEAQAAERAKAKDIVKAAKDAEKELKRVDKEQKAIARQNAADIAEVNRNKTDKKASLPEMIVEMESSFEGTSIGNQVVEYMKQAEVECSFFHEQVNLPQDAKLSQHPGKVIIWKRKSTALYNEDHGQWEPLPSQRIDTEPHVLVHLTAIEFATIAVSLPDGSTTNDESTMKSNLDFHITKIRTKRINCKPIYLIEGLTAWLKRNKTAKNREYTAAVLSQTAADVCSAPSSSQMARSKKRKTPSPALDLSFIDDDIAENLLLHLQLHPCGPKIHLTTSPHTTAAQILSFTEHISTIPYRQLKLANNLNNASFCMDVGQIRTGENALDTYVKMLQEVQRVTPSMAYGIANQWKTVTDLVKAFKDEGPLMLEDVRKSANKDGALSDRRLGPAVSKRLYKVFLGRDPNSMDI